MKGYALKCATGESLYKGHPANRFFWPLWRARVLEGEKAKRRISQLARKYEVAVSRGSTVVKTKIDPN